jgi:hypothetical protein
MNSFAHYAIGAVGEWMYDTMLGIRPTSPGFATIDIAPKPGPGITWAKGSHHSIRGTIESGWEVAGDETRYRIVIPPNVKARVVLPAQGPDRVMESGKPVGEAQGVSLAPGLSGLVVLNVGSGEYAFTVRR